MASLEDRVSALEDAVAALAANAAAKSGHAGEVESAAVGLLGPDEEDFDIEAEYGGEEADETDVEPVEVEVADAPSTEDDIN